MPTVELNQRVKMTAAKSHGRLVVIDDDLGMQSLLADVLSSVGYSVFCYSDVMGALKLITASEQTIDVVVCDLNMPGITGLELLEMLKKMNITTPVILITAFGTKETAAAAELRGAFGYLSKPFQLAEISDLVQRAVEKSA